MPKRSHVPDDSEYECTPLYWEDDENGNPVIPVYPPHLTHYSYHEPDFQEGDRVVVQDASLKHGTFRVRKDKDASGKDIWRFGVEDDEGVMWQYPGLRSQRYLDRLVREKAA